MRKKSDQSEAIDLSYAQAYAELEQIVHDIEDSEVDVDQLAARVKRGAALIAYCKAKLKGAEADLAKALDALKETEDPSAKEQPLFSDDDSNADPFADSI